MRLWPWSSLLSLYLGAWSMQLAGCAPEVPLGGDCLPFGIACTESEQRGDEDGAGDGDSAGDGDAADGDGTDVDAGGSAPLPDDAGHEQELDAGGDGAVGDAGSRDGGALSDDAGATADAGTVLVPEFANASFELQKGSSAGDFGANPLSNTDISPWYQCQVPGASFLRVEESANGDPVTEGSTALSFVYPYVVDLPIPVYQELSEPLKAGQRYAFMVDVRAEGPADMLALSVRGGSATCEALTTLGGTEYLPNGVWLERCIAFTPPRDLSQIALVPVVRGVVAPTFELYVDNLREDPRCR